MSSALDYVILGRDTDDGGRKRHKLLLFNGAPPSMDPKFYRQLIDLEPRPDAGGKPGPALALVEYDATRMVLAIMQPGEDNARSCTEHYVFLPADALAESALQLELWFAFLPEVSQDINRTLPLLPPPDFESIAIGARAENLQRIMDELPDDSFEHILTLLGALIHERRLNIPGFPDDFKRRLALISGIQSLIPGRLASRMTFASQTPLKCLRRPQLTFADERADASPWIYDWADPAVIPDVLAHPYIEVLQTLWNGDVAALAADIQSLARLAQFGVERGELGQELEQLADSFWVDRHIRAPAEDVATDAILRVLDNATPPPKEIRFQYIRKLLRNALGERDAAAGRRVAEELDRDDELKEALSNEFDDMLEDQPDAVYVFIRNRLTHLGFDEEWIPRLQTAARNSLEVAIQDGDAGTLAGWLELIAHEPQTYRLSDILRDGIIQAKTRAYADGDLGIHLILIAARRVPDIVDALYQDAKLIGALESEVRVALQTSSADALERLVDQKAEYFLLALVHGIQVSDEILVTLLSARRLWSLYETAERVNLPAAYRPPAIVRLLTTEASQQLTDEAINYLFEKIVGGDDRKLMADAARHYAERELLFPRLSQALETDEVPPDKALAIMNIVSGIKSTSPHNVIEAYFSLLDYYQWEPQTRRLTEALARVLAKQTDVQLSYRHLWKLFDSCLKLEIEGAARVSMTHLLLHYAAEDDLAAVVDGLARICRQVHLNKTLQTALDSWWRRYTHGLSLTQLQRLERELEPQRHIEHQKHILYSVLAMRRWLHSQSPAEFAESINTTFAILEHITDAFDATHIHEIDSYTIRREVDEVSQGLSSEQRHILANNLRNLAHRITQMAERRSKPSLIRSDDSIERQLQHGEANPQGSIDMMKWIAGYLDGAHAPSED